MNRQAARVGKNHDIRTGNVAKVGSGDEAITRYKVMEQPRFHILGWL